jgi:4-diphosphocytidyl-2-C-methyl-D-erythritol kinase
VPAALTESAPAKINLTLRVSGRRADGYHDLESLVIFADLCDRLTLQPGPDTALDVAGSFAGASGAVSDNLVLKVFAALHQSVDGLKGGRFQLEKNIPVAAGIGGGSADAAAALRLLARLNGIALDDARLMVAALKVGADVPVCFSSRACVMTGIGERLSPPLDLPTLPALLVNPGVPVATRDVFAKFTDTPGASRRLGVVPKDAAALVEFLRDHGNDLTDAAVACAPVVADVLGALSVLPGALLARMSGSGSTCFALFATAREAEAAARQLAVAHASWWVRAVRLGAACP